MKRKGSVLVTLGLLLMAAALLLTVYNLYERQRAERFASLATEKLESLLPAPVLGENEEEGTLSPEPSTNGLPDSETEIPDYILNPNMEMPVETVDDVDYVGLLQIPALELELPIISQWSYASLKKAPCRYSGSVYNGSLILAGHNYTSHFGKLRKLHTGDRVIFTDMDGNVFRFSVAEMEVLQANDLEGMENSDYPLTLFTCTAGRQSRITIRCQKEE